MKKLAGFASLFLFTILSIVIYLICTGDHFTYYYQTPAVSAGEEISFDVNVDFDDPDIIRFDGSEITGTHRLKLNFSSVGHGRTSANIHIENENMSTDIKADFLVGTFGQITAEISDSEFLSFQGWPAVIIGITLYNGIVCLLLFLSLRRRYRVSAELYSYNTIVNSAAFLNFLVIFLLLLAWCACLIHDPEGYTFSSSVNLLMQMSTLSVALLSPLTIVFSVLISVSNISLIRHEGLRITNLLGIGIGIFLSMLSVLFYILFKIGYPVRYALSIYAALVFFFQSLLAAAIICSFTAAVHKPLFNKDYIIILGCGIKKDGTLMPLLRGRVDRAIRFYREQLAATGKQACFIPSGGQGSDEIISESEAMKRYLLAQGIEESIILKEDQSTNTMENMKFSKRIIDKHSAHANVVFSTTNYHVFRSGMYAVSAGLSADGIGSRTRWYFWPNAFVREFIGVLVRFWKLELFAFFIVLLLAVVNLQLYNHFLGILISM